MKSKKGIIAAVALVLLIAVMAAVYFSFQKAPVEGNKTITIEIYHLDANAPKTITINTNADYLKEAVEEKVDLAGYEDAFGFWCTGLDGYDADDSIQEWWGFTKDGEYVEYALDKVVIEDGDKYEFTLNVGFDIFE